MSRPTSSADAPSLRDRLLPDTFLLYLLATVALATLLPARGAFALAVGWLSTLTVVMLFFFAGVKLAREQIVAGLLHWRLHLAILLSTFVFFPLVGLTASRLFPALMPPLLWTGILFVCALPSTVQSAIALVTLARGNVAGAIAAASASQLLGVVLTPVIMSMVASTRRSGVGVGGVGAIGAQILLPFLAGHLLRSRFVGWVGRHKRLVGLTDRGTIIISVYAAFSAAVLGGLWHRLPLIDLARLAGVDAALLAIGLGSTLWLGRTLGLSREDRITIQFCGTKKSLVQGVPMAKVLFAGPQAGVILLPIMLFHQMQLMACTILARRYGSENPGISGMPR